VPSGVNTDLGSKELRELLFEESQIEAWYTFENREAIFPIHRSFKFVLLATQLGLKTEIIPCAFYLHKLDVLNTIERKRLTVGISLIRKFSPESLSVTEFRSQRDIDITEKIYGNHPLLGEHIPNSWNVYFLSELHRTNDSHLFNTEGKGWPLYEGKMFHQFRHDFAPPEYWVEEKTGLNELLQRYIGKNRDTKKVMTLSSPSVKILPPQQYRLAFRLIASSTNERTLISTILPRNVFVANSAAIVYSSTGTNNLSKIPQTLPFEAMAYLSGILNSFVLDYVVRQKVSANLNFFYIYQLPVPRSPQKDIQEQIVNRVLKLISTTKEYESFAKHFSRSTRPLSIQERKNLVAEINAYVALLYGLDENDLSHILSTFPLVAEDEKKLVLEKFIELKSVKTQIRS